MLSRKVELPGKRNKILISLLVLIILLGSGCWYYSFTEKPYPHIENTYIEAFENETDRYDIAPAVTDGLIMKLQGAGLFKLAGREESQSLISGIVRSYEREAYTYTAGEEPLDYIVRIRAQVEFYDVKAGKSLWKTTLEGFSTYPADESTKNEETAREEAIGLLVERIIDRLRQG